MQKFFVGVLVKLIADPEVQKFLMQVVDRLGALLLPKLASVIPAVGASVLKLLEAHIPGLRLPGLPDITEALRDGVNELLPEDVDIPILSDAIEAWTGFDLTDVLTGRHK